MQKRVTIVLISVFVLAFAIGVMAPSSHASFPKEIKCWNECIANHYYECCKYVVSGSGGGTFTECEYTGYMCAY